MIPTSYNYGQYYRGDTVPKKVFQLVKIINGVSSAIDLTDAAIKCTFKNETNNTYTFQVDSGITVTDAANGQFEIDAFICDYYGAFRYDIEITFSDGTVKTYVNGVMNVQRDVR